MRLLTYIANKLAISAVSTQQLADQYACYILQHLNLEYHQEYEDIPTLIQEHIDQIIYEMGHNQKPLAYCLGSTPFLDLTLAIAPPTLIPRQETEQMCHWIREAYADKKISHILDIGTGSGCIALSLAKAFPQVSVTATDISAEAITLAQQNAKKNNVTNVTFKKTSLLPSEMTSIDLIVSNPPYLSSSEWESLDPSVKEWEDKRALIADDDGLAIYKAIIDNTPSLGYPDVVFEFGVPEQAPKIEKFLKDVGYSKITIHTDLYERKRWIAASLILKRWSNLNTK